MNLKPLAYLFVRFHGILFLIYSIYEITFLPASIRMVTIAEKAEPFHSEAMTDLSMLMLRFFIQVVMGCILLAKTDRIINFLLVDLTEKQKEEKLIKEEAND